VLCTPTIFRFFVSSFLRFFVSSFLRFFVSSFLRFIGRECSLKTAVGFANQLDIQF
jgi:hypothetical protein